MKKTELEDYIKDKKNHYISLFNENPRTDAGNSILDFYRGAIHALIELEKIIQTKEEVKSGS